MRKQIMVLAACAGWAWGQGPGVMVAPALGYYYDASAHAIRALGGVPGAAIADAAVAIPSSLKNAWVSPAGSVALADSKDSSALLLVSWGDGDASAEALAGAPGAPDLVAFSPGGDNAAVYYQNSATVWVWTNLTGDAAAGPQLDVSGLGAAVAAIAISDDGQVAVSAGGVFLLGAQGARAIAPNAASALAFAPGNHELAVADASRDQVAVAMDVMSNAGLSSVADSSTGIAQPVAIAFSADGLRLVVGNTRTQTVELVDAGGAGALGTAACRCTPGQLVRTRGNAVFLAGTTPEGALALFNGDADTPDVSAIPASAGGGN